MRNFDSSGMYFLVNQLCCKYLMWALFFSITFPLTSPLDLIIEFVVDEPFVGPQTLWVIQVCGAVKNGDSGTFLRPTKKSRKDIKVISFEPEAPSKAYQFNFCLLFPYLSIFKKKFLFCFCFSRNGIQFELSYIFFSIFCNKPISSAQHLSLRCFLSSFSISDDPDMS